MEDYLRKLLTEFEIKNSKAVESTLSKLADNQKLIDISKTIKELNISMIELFTMHKEKEEFKEAHIIIPNANAKKEYQFTFDLSLFPNIRIQEINNLESVGLQFDAEKARIYGVPTVAETIDIQIVFFNKNDENLETDIKVASFIVNADPKDLWLNKPSPADSRFFKVENINYKSTFLDKKIVVSSKRGRSHAHNATFRDDDFLVKNLPNDWAIVAVADGAGSAEFARAGSKFACDWIAESFNNEEILNTLSQEVTQYFATNAEVLPEIEILSIDEENKSDSKISIEQTEDLKLKSKNLIVNVLYKNIKNLQNELLKFAESEEITLKDIHTTLIFTLIKKFQFGYVVLSFGVGDCPINVINKDQTDVHLLNFLDVGESSGATRFMTMPEIFGRPDMVNRFGLNCFPDFSKLILMTDGIYDPKFVVESKLENIESWNDFLRDLSGENEDFKKVDFVEDSNIENQLSDWMDFWSKGNHDDRTLAIIY
ncbi:PP2C family serine/threonine-protein phosphatase [Frigoriflavimonas asaccharolytica]|uniref:Serine/threonine protein phosphatase PrpC n=1 Tax=Frigoriflavimonas asaccharolytica TaxID=2735899 RepID=A0A8J8GB31_9FLAO|nr:PP2C family serine/threonine-protein phosphatase [Frigoriflavimonas asaccharolytica]NRS93252.1 serine/threonine protein phosphatase PrpC [Frigoriflavimonas asaccharolytica]